MNQIINTNTITHDINNFKAVFSQDRKIIGLDVGKKTIGIAISDPISKIALTHKTIFRKKLNEDIQVLQEIINYNTAVSIVIGLPLNKDGTKGPIAQSVITFSHVLLNRPDPTDNGIKVPLVASAYFEKCYFLWIFIALF